MCSVSFSKLLFCRGSASGLDSFLLFLCVYFSCFSSLSDKDDDSYPDIFDDFPYDSTVWNDTDGDGWPDPGQSNFVPDSLIDIDADGDNIPDEQEPAEQISLKATPFSLKDNSARTTAISFDMGYPLLKKDFITMKIGRKSFLKKMT